MKTNTTSKNTNKKTEILKPETQILAPVMPTGRDIFNWSIKQIAYSPKKINQTQIVLSAIHIGMLALMTWLSWEKYLKDPYLALYLITTLLITYIYCTLLGVRQKTAYSYTVKTDGASVEYQLHYPEFITNLFETVAILAILLLLFAAIYMGSLIFLLGPAAGMLAAAFHLMNWENPVHHECSLPWHQYYFVTIDRKRLMVITHHTDLTVGFGMRFPSETMIEKYLNFLKATLPPTAKFIEKEWEW